MKKYLFIDRIIQVMNLLEFHARHENHENLIIPRQNTENHEILIIPRQNHENHENLIIPRKNLENHRIHRISKNLLIR